MRKMTLVWVLAFILLMLLPGSTLATPTPPYVIVNHTTKECAESILGDDCKWCDPPPGWEVLGRTSNTPCPDGYAWVEEIDMQCRGYETPFCCSDYSHRGNCENMVMHEGGNLCAFVDDIQDCVLPQGWTSRASSATTRDWRCPHDHSWIDPITCLNSADFDGTTMDVGPGTPSTTLVPDTPLRISTIVAALCLAPLCAVVVVVALALAIILAKRRQG